MGFPAAEMKMGGTYALIFTEVGQVMIVKVNPISGLLFYVKDFGIYQLNKKNALIFGKARVLFYDQKAINPINIGAFLKISNYLETRNLQSLSRRQIALLVDRIMPSSNMDQLARDIEGLGLKADEQAMKVLENSMLDIGVKEKEQLRAELGDDVVDFLNDYYAIDNTAHRNTRLKILEESDFKLKRSNKIIEWCLFQKTGFSRNIALVVIDNRVFEAVPAKTEVRIVDGLAKTFLLTEDYGDFEIEGNKNIFRHKKTSLYVVAVKTSEEFVS